jgi:hypothetical protein
MSSETKSTVSEVLVNEEEPEKGESIVSVAGDAEIDVVVDVKEAAHEKPVHKVPVEETLHEVAVGEAVHNVSVEKAVHNVAAEKAVHKTVEDRVLGSALAVFGAMFGQKA